MSFTKDLPPIAEGFLQFCLMNENRSENTISEYALDLKVFFRFMMQQRDLVPSDMSFEEIPISDIDLAFVENITRQDIIDYVEYLRMHRVSHAGTAKESTGLSPSATRRKISCIRSFFEYLCVHKELISNDPTTGVIQPTLGQTLPVYLTENECFSLLKAITGPDKERNFAIVLLSLLDGLRVSEIVGINLNDLKISNSEAVLTIHGKGNKQRQVFLTQNCVDAIQMYKQTREVKYKPDKKSENALFLSRKHKRMSVDAVQLMLKNACQKAGVTLVSPHKLRHTSATLMLKNGVDLRVISEILGHASLTTTQRYTHVESDDMKVAGYANPMSKASTLSQSKDEKSSKEDNAAVKNVLDDNEKEFIKKYFKICPTYTADVKRDIGFEYLIETLKDQQRETSNIPFIEAVYECVKHWGRVATPAMLYRILNGKTNKDPVTEEQCLRTAAQMNTLRLRIIELTQPTDADLGKTCIISGALLRADNVSITIDGEKHSVYYNIGALGSLMALRRGKK